MVRVGITGQNGFIGKHLYNTLNLDKEEFAIVDFSKDFFDQDVTLDSFVEQCDVIVHLAALNRHNNPETIYSTNVDLVAKLIKSLNRTNKTPHILFSSSSQEERDNLYGKSKKDGRELLVNWAKANGGKVTGMVIPNVFGPFGNPFYNSVIATFSHQLTHNEMPKIDVDGSIKLIYVGDLVKRIVAEIRTGEGCEVLVVPHTDEYKVSEILKLLEVYKEQYFDRGIIPQLKTSFELNLFNTFRCYIDVKQYFPFKLTPHADNRGVFVEIIKLNEGGQVSFSTTVGGVTRGNHFHTRKIERFAVIKGSALIQLRQIGTDKIMDFNLSGNEPAYVDMPIWYTHNIKNTGTEQLLTIFWINEFYDAEDPDTYFEVV
jgi:UDP-2-acetamido-2,6-beta-L-arabino-hexul-4-ose reductase